MSKIIKMTRKPSVLMMIVFGVLALSFYKLIVVDRMGFCYKRLWFVSSEELILKQISTLMKSKSGVMKLDAADTSPEAYLARHPNCCHVSWGTEHPFQRGLIHFGSAEVRVTYELSDEGKKHYGADNVENYYEFIVDYTACGEPLHNTGTSTTAPIAR
ncbi:MAG: hypothetical protein ABL911_00950 [Gallionella sp.]|nr:hypothetical protein [Gallionella sp.]